MLDIPIRGVEGSSLVGELVGFWCSARWMQGDANLLFATTESRVMNVLYRFHNLSTLLATRSSSNCNHVDRGLTVSDGFY